MTGRHDPVLAAVAGFLLGGLVVDTFTEVASAHSEAWQVPFTAPCDKTLTPSMPQAPEVLCLGLASLALLIDVLGRL